MFTKNFKYHRSRTLNEWQNRQFKSKHKNKYGLISTNFNILLQIKLIYIYFIILVIILIFSPTLNTVNPKYFYFLYN